MKTIGTKEISSVPLSKQEGSFGKIKRIYAKPNVDIGYYESLSLIK